MRSRSSKSVACTPTTGLRPTPLDTSAQESYGKSDFCQHSLAKIMLSGWHVQSIAMAARADRLLPRPRMSPFFHPAAKASGKNPVERRIRCPPARGLLGDPKSLAGWCLLPAISTRTPRPAACPKAATAESSQGWPRTGRVCYLSAPYPCSAAPHSPGVTERRVSSEPGRPAGARPFPIFGRNQGLTTIATINNIEWAGAWQGRRSIA